MADTFRKQSKQIADKFIQNIVFIDDKAYENDETKNAFNASAVAKIFADEGKICAIYAPQSKGEAKKYDGIIAKADVVILDWYICVNDPKEANPEADADADDPRGEFTLNLIARHLAQQKESLKLFVVYTGETNLSEIAEEIHKKVNDDSFSLSRENCSVSSANVKIVVRAKSQNDEHQFEHVPEYKNKIAAYDNLPNLILDEFTDMTSGLLSNFALSAITAIRENTSRMLRVFSPDLDPAYLGHKVLLEDTAESKHMLIKLFGEAISELLEVTDIDTETWVENWINSKIEDKSIDINGVSVDRTKDVLIKMLISGKEQLYDKFQEASEQQISKSKIEKIKTHTAEFFKHGDIDINNANFAFAKLTHHKNPFKPLSGIPLMTLGTIVKKDEAYYVCIQQRCDSVRIKEGQRPFLFLPLIEKGDTPIVVKDDLRLCPDKTSYAIMTVLFRPQGDETVIRAIKVDGRFVFQSLDDGNFEWIVDLKDLHAQRIINNYCAQLSRVGLNESEWLRLSAKH